MHVGQKDFIVFLIGFRVNSWPRVIWHTLRQFGQFGKFANSTFQFGSRTPNAKEGCLGSTAYGSTIGGDMAVVQYWRSFEDLWVRCLFLSVFYAHHPSVYRVGVQKLESSSTFQFSSRTPEVIINITILKRATSVAPRMAVPST